MSSLDFEELVDDSCDTVDYRLRVVTDHIHRTVHTHLALGLSKLELRGAW